MKWHGMPLDLSKIMKMPLVIKNRKQKGPQFEKRLIYIVNQLFDFIELVN